MSGPVNCGSLQHMERIAGGARFLMGHNVIAFDIPHLQAFAADLSLLRLPVMDTLRLNPLAFPRHLYHHLATHYEDGDLVRRQRNDPLLDSKLAVEASANRVDILAGASTELPDCVALADGRWERRRFRPGPLPAAGENQVHSGGVSRVKHSCRSSANWSCRSR